MANNLPAKLWVWSNRAIKEQQGMHPREHNIERFKGSIQRYIEAINAALDAHTEEARKTAGRFTAVPAPSPEELVKSDEAKKSIAYALGHALADAGFWGGTSMPCPLPGQQSNDLYAYFTSYARQPAMVGLTKAKGVSSFPDTTGGDEKPEDASA